VDIDKPTLDWGRQENLSKLGPAADRITLVCDDVRNVKTPKVDLVVALNYSFCIFKKRSMLVQYFRAAAQSLVKDGIFVCDIYGGAEAVIPCTESRDYGSFTYTWEQEWFNPLTHESRCHIHFSFPDKSTLRAFSYDWRWWSIPEIKESLEEAGFSTIKIWWKNTKRSKQNKKGAHKKAQRGQSEESGDEKSNKEEAPEKENTQEGGESASESDNDGDGDGSSEEESEGDELSGDEMDEYIEVERVKQTKAWNAYVIGIL